jgi:integrase/recombinase XerC
MTTELAPLLRAPDRLPALARVDVLAAFLAGRNPRTLAAYSKDLADFARFVGAASSSAGVERLLGLSHGDANAVALGYRAHLAERGLKAATIARRLAALRSVVRLARTLGRIAWTLDVESPRAEPYRDTTGPGDAGWHAMLGCAKRSAETRRPKAVRDLALVRLLHDLGLRRGEAVALDVADLDVEGGTVAVVGKGRGDATRLTLPDPTRDALADWAEVRGPGAGPLFVRLDRAAETPTRLTGTAVFKIVRDLGRRAGLGRPTRPHALRHQAITRALDATHGDVRTVQRFSRHADPRTLLRYDDRRKDVAGDVARLVAEG